MPPTGKYELLDLLGRGGCGEVWKARDTQLDRIVALKLMQRTGPEDLERFKREAHVVARLSHPNIAQLHEFSAEPPYLAMQYVDGGPISEAKDKIAALRDAARAVHFAHQRGILHRDLKPANIMVDTSGRASVLDFGLAREVRADPSALTMSGDILGTPGYMAPEQARGDVRALDARTDVYGLGATLYFLLTGRPPHTGATAYDVIRSVLDAEPLRPGGERDLETICLKAIEKDPARRYASADEFADDLGRFLDNEPIRARPASTLYRLKKRIQRQPAVWCLSALLVAAIVGGSGFGLEMLLQRLDQEQQAADDAKRRLEAEGLLEAARRAIHRLDIMAREAEADPTEPQVAAEALDWLAKSDEVYPDLAETNLERGRVYALKGDEEAALGEFSKAIERAPQLAGARLERATILSSWYEERRHEAMGPKEETAEMVGLQARIEEDVRAVEAWSKDERDVENAKGILAFGEGRYAEAVAALQDYVGRNPVDAAAWDRLGHSLYHLDRHAEAIEALTKALHHRPRFVGAFVRRGLVRADRGDLADAIADYDEALRIDPRNEMTYYNRGNARMAGGNLLAVSERLEEARVEWAGAIADYDKALDINSRYAEAYTNRGNARQAGGDSAGAIADYDEALKINPRLTEAHYGRGNARKAGGDLAGAIADYGEALKIDPRYAGAYVNRGNARAAVGDLLALSERLEEARVEWAGAIADYDEALKIDPRHAQVYVNRGIARQAGNDPAGAIADYGEALKIDPRHADAYYNRGIVRQDGGDRAGAIADYDDALKTNPRLVGAYVNRGIARQAGGDLAGAIADYGEALKIDPRHAAAYSNRGNARDAGGDPAGAIADYDEALKINPRHAQTYYNRGSVRQVGGDPAGAIADYDEALKINPRFAEALANRGTAKEKSGDLLALRARLEEARVEWAGAAADVREALRVAPANWPYRKAAEGRLRDVEAKLGTDF